MCSGVEEIATGGARGAAGVGKGVALLVSTGVTNCTVGGGRGELGTRLAEEALGDRDVESRIGGGVKEVAARRTGKAGGVGQIVEVLVFSCRANDAGGGA